MENYSKARTVEHPCPSPFLDLPSTTPEVRVRDGSKIRNLMRYALSRMEPKPRAAEDDKKGQSRTDDGVLVVAMETREVTGRSPTAEKPLSRNIVFTATGKGVSKAITCVEMMKRRVKGLHQHTKLLYSKVDEVWEPLEPTAGLDSLTVSRNVPAIWILLSRDPIDASLPGYQAPANFDALWAHSVKEEAGASGGQRHGHNKRKRGGGGSGGRGKGGPGRHTGRPKEPFKGQS